MRAAGLLAVLAVAQPCARLSAQMSLRLSAGARYTSTLVHDSIVTPLDVRPAIAPAFSLTAATPGEHGWTPEVGVDLSSSTLWRHDQNGATTDLGRLTTVALTVRLARILRPGVVATIGVGGLKYLPSENSGVFRLGAGALAPIGSLALRRDVPMAGGRLAIEARYDIHQFSTPALRAEGFHGSQLVHRVAVSLSAGLGGGEGGR